MNESTFNHKLMYVKNYINEPKDDGYRGIHQIYQYHVEPRKGHASHNQPWNGMRVEVQYRTLVQHIWATAVETAGLLTANNPKFGQGSIFFIEFFQICSEMLARNFEQKTSCLPKMSNKDLVARFDVLKTQTHIIDIFANVNSQVYNDKFEKTSILIFYYETENEKSKMEVRSYDSVNQGIKDYGVLEKDLEDLADVVLVKTDAQDSMRSAYRNYFADTADFITMVENAKHHLSI